ncbi:MAG: DNA-processing protein DprA [Lachnospiraceae bacterium]
MKYENWLAGITEISGRKKIKLESYMGSAKEVYDLNERQLERTGILTKREEMIFLEHKKNRNLQLEEEICSKEQIQLINYGRINYPSRLLPLYNPPYGIYYKGRLPEENKPSIAVVGARRCSSYGSKIAEQIGYRLGLLGITVVSGMAEGIDGQGHQGTLKAGGATYGVLGCGIDVCYPVKNRTIYEEIPKKGGLLSEYPPGTKPLPIHFPARNRLISGLADFVIVVEARKKSGSLITADFALEQGKDVFAVPGRISDALSGGTNELIQQGAGIFLGIENVLSQWSAFTDTSYEFTVKTENALEKLERLVYSCLDLTPRNLEELMKKTELTLPQLIQGITGLREKAFISEVYKNYFIRSNADV